MKGTRKQYRKIKQLPADAKSVANYARLNELTVAGVYHRFDKGLADYQIVDFQGYNFIVINH